MLPFHVTASTLTLIAIALVAANLPFISERILFVRLPRNGVKGIGWRLLELFLLYCLVGVAAWLLESREAVPHRQGWEFYAITVCLFLVFAYPGFVARYLWKGRTR